MDWQTVGHKQIKSLFEDTVRSKAFAHAYAFVGPKGVGKYRLAEEIASSILGGESKGHPDFLYFDAGMSSDIETLREFLARTAFAPVKSQKTVVVLDNADSIPQTNANVLLKILEEPSARAIFFLISHTKRLPATVFSRCVVCSFLPLSQSEVQSLCEQSSLVVAKQELLAASGSFGALLQLKSDPRFQSVVLPFAQFMVNLNSKSRSERVLMINNASMEETEVIYSMIFTSICLLKDTIVSSPGVWKRVSSLLEALSLTNTNTNKKLILQSILL